MKHVLVIANLFHASPRIPGLTTYFPQSGWRATILTPPFSPQTLQRLGGPKDFSHNVELISAPFKGDVFEAFRILMGRPSPEIHESMTENIKKHMGAKTQKRFLDRLIWLAHLILAYPDTEKTWIRSCIQTAEAHLKDRHYDAIMSSSPFPTTHIIAHEIKKRYAIPWCADFRDPWTQNHTYDFPWVRKFFEERLEKRILQTTDAVTTAAPSYSAKQTHLLGRIIHTIPNGFDPDQYPKTSSMPLDTHFSLTYTGTIYPGKQNPLPLLDALQSLAQENRIDTTTTRVTFYGKKQEWFVQEIAKRNLQEWVKVPGTLSRQDIISKQRSSQILLLLGWENLNDSGIYPSKLFEYLGARRPILIVGGSKNEEIKKIVHDAHAGDSGITSEEIKRAILHFYTIYKEKGYVPYEGKEDKIMAYSFPHLAEQYCKILNQLTKTT